MIQLTPIAMADDAMKDLYNEAFPLEERRPWPLEEQLIAAGRLRILRITSNAAFAGFVFYWQLPDFYFIEHFAIHPSARGGGAGTQVMQLLEKQLQVIVLEVEPPVTAQAIRRINFYERLGYQTFPDHYQQPAYYPQFPPLELCIMHKGLSPETMSFSKIKSQLYQYVYNQ
ncbi:GNAT family N-acetyltransferase [Chitinophaga eiseniae]|uniref:GNAT family N-acetyltransferase n=1 Tax=Chitinophaga eiseniae TaxID=634771 RepID=A0A847SLM0_9BACT|nr:GNAT family N-acetyltransferase [Chitinophaga eiseniae]NLR79707.1 GNAT family N-acetyltransferase [Chitinophaga eiseniae]